MYLNRLTLCDVRCFENENYFEFSTGINLLLGENNSGKSTILSTVKLLQHRALISTMPFNRVGKKEFFVIHNLMECRNYFHEESNVEEAEVYFNPKDISSGAIVTFNKKDRRPFPYLINTEPNNFIFSYSSKRNVKEFNKTLNNTKENQLDDSFTFLINKIYRHTNTGNPHRSIFFNIIKDIIGFDLNTYLNVNNTIDAGYYINDSNRISIERMGEGTKQLIGFVFDLFNAKGKLFLIEELENDIHPRALKKLLNLIIEKSNENQFIISTHSNLVAKYLGSCPTSKLFYLNMNFKDNIPTTIINELKTPEERIQCLSELGYDLFDFDLWSGFLLLEESTAERIIRDILIPNFVPSLINKLKTISCNGTSKIEPSFEDFIRLLVYIHNSPMYHNKGWVICDDDESGKSVISNLKNKFQKSWDTNNFQNWTVINFEKFYPNRFEADVEKVLGIQNSYEKMKAKGKLCEEVCEWFSIEKETAISEFSQSANEVINKLKEIESKLVKN